jgi:hypothetical protein
VRGRRRSGLARRRRFGSGRLGRALRRGVLERLLPLIALVIPARLECAVDFGTEILEVNLFVLLRLHGANRTETDRGGLLDDLLGCGREAVFGIVNLEEIMNTRALYNLPHPVVGGQQGQPAADIQHPAINRKKLVHGVGVQIIELREIDREIALSLIYFRENCRFEGRRIENLFILQNRRDNLEDSYCPGFVLDNIPLCIVEYRSP